MVNDNSLKSELDLFFQLVSQIKTNNQYKVTEIDQYGFEIQSNIVSDKSSPAIMICGLTHGNEILGLQVINQLLNQLSGHKISCYKLIFLLNNYAAYQINERYVDIDLNRSFKHQKQDSQFFEHKRSKEIESLILKFKPNFILDLHQTIEPTKSSFFILPENPNLIQLTRRLHSQWPILCFDQEGFSSDGYTLLEFAFQEKIACLVLEMSQNGFDLIKAQEVSAWILKKILQELHFLTDYNYQIIEYFKIRQRIEKTKNRLNYLVPGFINLDQVHLNQKIGSSEDPKNQSITEIKSLYEGYILFPKYGQKVEQANELGLIAERKILTQLKLE